MAEARLAGSDKRALLLWVIAGILGAIFAYKYFFRAFPEASVDFKVSRAEAQERAKEFVEGLGENIHGYQSTIVFDVDENAKTYLERALGLQQANHLMSSELNIWYWEVRFFRPQQEEEFQVRVNPAGKVVGYEHKLEEARKGESPTREEAQAEAQKFLQNKLGVNLESWTSLTEEANSQTRPNRLDWSFTWERKGFKAKEAPYRLTVGLAGGKIGDAQEFLQVPEEWTRAYQKLRSANIFYNQAALLPFGFLLGGALWLGVSLTRQGKTSWAGALVLGGLVAALSFLMEMNQWEVLRAGYDTHSDYGSFVLRSVLTALVGGLVAGLLVTLVLPGGEPLYRGAQPRQLRLFKTFSLRGLRSKEFFCASVVGLAMTAAHLGFLVAFYLIGNRLGVWAPQDLNYSEAVNTRVPWIAGVAVGLMAATSEEFLFRLFAIPFLRRLTGSRMAAVILPAFFWGFLHSAYPTEPGYVRGIEVGLIGIAAGLVMLRWGIVATLIWHYTVDASLVGMVLIRSGNLYFKISGIVVGLAAVAPLAFSGVSYLLRGRFEPVDDLLNEAQPKTEIDLRQQTVVEEAAVSKRQYSALTTGTIGFLALCLVVGGVLGWRLKPETIGDYLRLSVDSRAASTRADPVLREHGLDPHSYRKAVQLVDTTNPVVNEFLRRRMPVSEINKIYSQRVPGALWRVRYFRDSQPEEFAITMKPDGSQHAYRHTEAEAAKGATLSKEEAEKIAETYLRDKKNVDLGEWKLVEANSDKRPHRTDHTLTWQQNSPLDPESSTAKDPADHAYARMEVQVLGDEPANYRTYIKIPEEFQRRQQEQTLPRTLLSVGQAVLGVGLVITVLIYYFKRLRVEPTAKVPWKRILLWGLVGACAFTASFLFGVWIPNLLSQYPTAVSLPLFFATMALVWFITSVFVLGGIVLMFGFAWHFAARAFGEENVPVWMDMPADYYRDAFWIGLGGSAALIGLRHVLETAAHWWPTLHRVEPSSTGNFFDALYPAAGVCAGALVRGLLLTGIVALASAFVGAEMRARWVRLLLFLGVAAAFVSNWGTPADFLKQFLLNAVLLAFVVFGIRGVARFNILGWFLVVAGVSLLSGALELLGQPDGFYRTQGYLVLTALVLLLGWPLVAWRMRLGNSGAAT